MNNGNDKNIYWIGKDIDKDNKNKNELKRRNFNFNEFQNIKNALDNLKLLDIPNGFVFVIINCELFENFIEQYDEEYVKTNKVIINSIVFCDNLYEHINKKFINDPFYNPGGITDNIMGVINYINYVQNIYYKFPKNENCLDLTEHHKNKFGEMKFQIVSEEKDFIIPVIWNKIVNLKINGFNLAQLQKILVYNHPDVKDYIYPSREKIIKISEHLLAKYFLFLYTKKSGFYSTMNRILSHDDGFDIYKEYITIMFRSLKNKTFETYTKTKLYRGSKIAKNDFEKLCNLFEKKTNEEKIIFFSKSFLSFSKYESVADEFLGLSINNDNPNLILCKFIVYNGGDSIAFNIDIKDNSAFGTSEQEVLFLPMSCFLVVNIEKGEQYSNIIYLKYLDEFNKKVEEKFGRIKESIKDQFDFENSFLNNYGKNIYKLYPNIIDDYTKYIKDKFLINIKTVIPDYQKEYTIEEKKVEIKFDTEDEVKKILNEEKLIQTNKKVSNKVVYNVTNKDFDEKGFVKILGEKFVELNKDKIDLDINGTRVELCHKYKLNKGINEIIFNFKQNIKDFSYLFYEVTSLSEISGLQTWDTSEAINFKHLFSGCIQLSDISALSKWDTSCVENFSCLFYNCISLKDIYPLSGWNVSNGNFFSYLFYNCSSLEYLHGIKNWDVSKGKFFNCSFAYCLNLKNISALENWNTRNGIFFSHLFFNCSSLKDITALENWDITKGNFFDYIFCNCSSLIDISPIKDWNMSNGNNFSFAFSGCSNLIDISPLKKWNIPSDSNLTNMFKGCNILEETRPSWFYRTF